MYLTLFQIANPFLQPAVLPALSHFNACRRNYLHVNKYFFTCMEIITYV